MSQTEREGWSDAKKWQMDLLKSVIAFGVAALISLLVIEQIQHARAIE